MASIPFVKASACGNDFLIISIDHAPDDIAGFSCHICDRHNGVGADGVEWVVSASDADLGIRLINADGSDAEISGNGTRCVAAWYCSEHGQDSVSIHTDAGVKTCELKARIGNTFEFRTAMGMPEVGGERTVKLRDRVLNGITVSMGNPHFVVFVPEFEDGWQTWAGDASVHPDFPRGTMSSWSARSTSTKSKFASVSAESGRRCRLAQVRRLRSPPSSTQAARSLRS